MYRCTFYKGDYRERQEQANADRCVAYVEHHFDSSASPTASYAVIITGSNASQTSRNWGRWYAQAVAREFGVGVGGFFSPAV
jgi:N-acetylmuramoyl-L-alanine amidase